MHRKTRLILAGIISIYGLVIYLSVQATTGQLSAGLSGDVLGNNLIVIVAAFLGGYVTAALFGKSGLSGVIIRASGGNDVDGAMLGHPVFNDFKDRVLRLEAAVHRDQRSNSVAFDNITIPPVSCLGIQLRRQKLLPVER